MINHDNLSSRFLLWLDSYILNAIVDNYFNYATNLNMKFNGGHKLSNILMIRLDLSLAFHQGSRKRKKGNQNENH